MLFSPSKFCEKSILTLAFHYGLFVAILCVSASCEDKVFLKSQTLTISDSCSIRVDIYQTGIDNYTIYCILQTAHDLKVVDIGHVNDAYIRNISFNLVYSNDSIKVMDSRGIVGWQNNGIAKNNPFSHGCLN
jgi:hypothetical protein